MRRFRGLWGAPIGAVGLPLLMCFCLWSYTLVAPWSLLTLLSMMGRPLVRDGLIIGVALGALGGLFVSGQRSFLLRVLGGIASATVAVFYSYWMWGLYDGINTPAPFGWYFPRKEIFRAHLVTFAPIILWAVILLFYTLVMRSHSTASQRNPII